jgi:hypothetical protein
MKRHCYAGLCFLAVGSVLAQTAPKEPPRPELTLPDQHERQHDLAKMRGDVVVLLYGDREGARQNQEIGERLHVEFHPTAKGLTGVKASQAPVAPLADLPQGKRSPDVKVIPVACVGKVPNVVRNVIRNQVKKATETLVWLDFEDRMKDTFGLTAGEPNLVVIDAEGKLRFRATGKLDEKSYARLTEVIGVLRKEAVEGK